MDLRQFTMCFQLGWKGPNLSLLKPPPESLRKAILNVRIERELRILVICLCLISMYYLLQRNDPLHTWRISNSYSGNCCECNFVVWYDLSFLSDILIKDSEKNKDSFFISYNRCALGIHIRKSGLPDLMFFLSVNIYFLWLEKKIGSFFSEKLWVCNVCRRTYPCTMQKRFLSSAHVSNWFLIHPTM